MAEVVFLSERGKTDRQTDRQTSDILIGSAVFAHTAAKSMPILFNGVDNPKIAHSPWLLGPGPPVSASQRASRSVQLFFAGLTNVTNRQTHRQTERQTTLLRWQIICSF